MNSNVSECPPTGTRSVAGLVTAVFEAWRVANIDFLVLRNYESLPHATSNDIDVLVDPAQMQRAEQILCSAAATAGFLLHNRAEFSPVSVFFHDPATGQQVHFDLFASLRWRGFTLLPTRTVLAAKIARGQFAIPSPVHEAVLNLVTRLIYSGYVKDKYKPGILSAFRAHPDRAEAALSLAFGRLLARRTVAHALDERWKAIEQSQGALRRALVMRQAARRPLHSVAALARDAFRLLKRFHRTPGLTVVLLGADGCGKSTLAATLAENLGGSFPTDKGLMLHWKPALFSKRRRQGRPPTTDPHGRPPRSRPLSLAFFAGHWLEFFLGSLAQLRPVVFKNGLVIIDRYYFDFFIDQRRYRLRVPESVVRLGYALLPKPDLVFLLDAPPEVLQSRKQEVPFEETVRQREAFLKLVRSLPNGRVLDASRPAADVVQEATRATLEHLRARMVNRRPNHQP